RDGFEQQVEALLEAHPADVEDERVVGAESQALPERPAASVARRREPVRAGLDPARVESGRRELALLVPGVRDDDGGSARARPAEHAVARALERDVPEARQAHVERLEDARDPEGA